MDRKPPTAQCEWCGARMTLWVCGQRFHSRQCSEAWHLAERQQAVQKFRAEGLVVVTKRMKAAQGEEEEQERRSASA